MKQDNIYLSDATCVASFTLDKQMRYKLGDVEKYFCPLVSAQAVATNVPDEAPPDISRFTFQSGRKQIAVSQVAAQYLLNFQERKKSLDESIEIARSNILHFYNNIYQFKKDELTHIGMVFTINKQLDLPKDTISQRIFDRFLKMPMLGDSVASIGFQVGYLDNKLKLFNNIAVNHYEKREGKVNSRGGTTLIDLSTLSIKELGIGVKLDVNSRPMFDEKIAPDENLGDLVIERSKMLLDDYAVQLREW